MFTYIVLGNSGVGKTSLVNKLKTGNFNTVHNKTVGAIFYPYGSKSLCDTNGDFLLDGFRVGYISNATHAVILFDLGDLNSFKSVYSYVSELRKFKKNIQIKVIGNKQDLPSIVSDTDISKLIGDLNVTYTQMSVKNDTNIDTVFN